MLLVSYIVEMSRSLKCSSQPRWAATSLNSSVIWIRPKSRLNSAGNVTIQYLNTHIDFRSKYIDTEKMVTWWTCTRIENVQLVAHLQLGIVGCPHPLRPCSRAVLSVKYRVSYWFESRLRKGNLMFIVKFNKTQPMSTVRMKTQVWNTEIV